MALKGYRAASNVSLYANFTDANYPRAFTAEAEALGNNRHRVELSWTNGKRYIDVYRNGAILRTVRNIGAMTDTFRIIGSGTMEYKVCNNGTAECADPVTITYEASPGRR